MVVLASIEYFKDDQDVPLLDKYFGTKYHTLK